MTAFEPMPAAAAPSDNHNTPSAAETRAERHREAYAQRQGLHRPSLWAKARPWLLAGAFGLLAGGAAVGYRVLPGDAAHGDPRSKRVRHDQWAAGRHPVGRRGV